MILKIIRMNNEPQYNGRIGIVTSVDDLGQIHGTWGGCALVPGEDTYEEVKYMYDTFEKEWCEKYGYTVKHPYDDGYTEFYKGEKLMASFNITGYSDLRNITKLCEAFENELK